MSQPYPQLHREVTRTFGRLRPRLHRLSFDAPGGKVDMRAKLVEGATRLIVSFHGAVDRERRELPILPSGIPGIADAHQIGIADPSMSLLDKPFRISWYAGHEGFDAQGVIGTILNAAIRALKVQRTVYFGNSAGGFAALYYSWRHRGSYAVVGNPQTNIASYFPRFVDEYMQHCWPSLSGPEALSGHNQSDLTALYGKGFANTVVYIQALGDRMHYQNHLLPFVSAVSQTPDARRFLLHSDFGGQLGHVASPQDCVDWVTAVCNAPGKDPASILTTLHTLREARKGNALGGLLRRKPVIAAPAPRPARTVTRPARVVEAGAGTIPPPAATAQVAASATAPHESRGFAADDLAVAERLRVWQASQATKTSAT